MIILVIIIIILAIIIIILVVIVIIIFIIIIIVLRRQFLAKRGDGSTSTQHRRLGINAEKCFLCTKKNDANAMIIKGRQ